MRRLATNRRTLRPGAGFLHRVATHWILGIRPQPDGLLVDPSIPARWDGFKVTRKFRGATYQIAVSNPEHVNTGVRSLRVDGAPVEGQLIPVLADGKNHVVEVIMG